MKLGCANVVDVNPLQMRAYYWSSDRLIKYSNIWTSNDTWDIRSGDGFLRGHFSVSYTAESFVLSIISVCVSVPGTEPQSLLCSTLKRCCKQLHERAVKRILVKVIWLDAS